MAQPIGCKHQEPLALRNIAARGGPEAVPLRAARLREAPRGCRLAAGFRAINFILPRTANPRRRARGTLYGDTPRGVIGERHVVPRRIAVIPIIHTAQIQHPGTDRPEFPSDLRKRPGSGRGSPLVLGGGQGVVKYGPVLEPKDPDVIPVQKRGAPQASSTARRGDPAPLPGAGRSWAPRGKHIG